MRICTLRCTNCRRNSTSIEQSKGMVTVSTVRAYSFICARPTFLITAVCFPRLRSSTVWICPFTTKTTILRRRCFNSFGGSISSRWKDRLRRCERRGWRCCSTLRRCSMLLWCRISGRSIISTLRAIGINLKGMSIMDCKTN
jgi:hypothetical protein